MALVDSMARNAVVTTSYHAGRRKLLVVLNPGGVFEFHAVPERVAALVAQAADPTAYFEKNIRTAYPWAAVLKSGSR
jgi:hypothetical protein